MTPTKSQIEASLRNHLVMRLRSAYELLHNLDMSVPGKYRSQLPHIRAAADDAKVSIDSILELLEAEPEFSRRRLRRG